MRWDQGELDFAGARAAAILSRSFFEDRWTRVSGCRTVTELAQAVFPDRTFSLPEKRLVAAFQQVAAERARAGILTVLKAFKHLPPLLGAWADQESQNQEVLLVEAGRSRSVGLARWLRVERAMVNGAWALRMRFHYGWDLPRVRTWFKGEPDLIGAALVVFDLPSDNPSAWARWRFAPFLPEVGGGRYPDPMAFEASLRRWSHRKAWNLFHTEPSTVGAVYAFCRLMEAEAWNLASLAEAVGLGLPEGRRHELIAVAL